MSEMRRAPQAWVDPTEPEIVTVPMRTNPRLLLFAVGLMLIGCARAPRPFSLASFTKPDRHPDAKGAFDRCKKGLEGLELLESDARFARAIDACRELYAEPECGAVFTKAIILGTPLAQRARVVAKACGRPYCDLLASPKPEACFTEPEGLDAGDRNRRLADLHLSILTWELGVSDALRLLPELGGVRDQQSGHSLFFTDERAPETLSDAGGLDKDVLRPIIMGKAGEVRECYERVLQQDHGLALGLAVRFVINSEGKVRRSFVVAATRRERALESCIIDVHSTMVFPAPKGGGSVWVTFPYVLVFTED